MKTIFSFLLLACTTLAIAQPNNPYNQQCHDVYVSGNIVLEKLKKITDKTLTNEMIKEMQRDIPSKTQMDAQTAGQIFQAVKKSPLSITDALRKSNLSLEAQKEVSLIIKNATTLKKENKKQWLTERTSKILESGFSKNEKEVLLVTIGLINNQDVSQAKGIGCYTEVDGKVVYYGEGDDCIGVMAAAGFVIGASICGTPCGIAGAIIGAVVASVTRS